MQLQYKTVYDLFAHTPIVWYVKSVLGCSSARVLGVLVCSTARPLLVHCSVCSTARLLDCSCVLSRAERRGKYSPPDSPGGLLSGTDEKPPGVKS